MRTLKTLKTFSVFFATMLFAAASFGEVVTMANGDRVSGKVLSSTSDQVVLQTSFGVVTIPMNQVAQVLSQQQAEKEAEQKADTEKKAAVAASKAPSAPDPAAPEAKARTIEWIEDYRAFIKETLPEDLHMRIRGGVQYRQTASSTLSVSAAFDLVQQFDELQTFKSTIYYDYANETSSSSVDNVTLDKYGIDTDYRRNFDETKHWYFGNLLSYKVDMVRGIKDQVDEAATVGYRFDFNRYDLILDIAPGPAVRYINARNYDTHWVAMAVISESLVWKLNDLMRFEQSLYAGFNLQKPDEYSAYLKLGLVANVSEVMDIALRYSYEYDAINSSSSQKSEQILTLSFEFPFNWKH